MKSVLGSPCGTSDALGRTLCSRLAKCSRKRLRISFPVTGGRFSLGGQTLQSPNSSRPADIAEAIVEAIFATLPELDPAWAQCVAAPVRGQGDAAGMLASQLQHVPFEHVPRRNHAALSRREGGQLRAARPAPEVGERRLGVQASHGPGDTDLVVGREPVEDDGRAIVFGEVAALAALVVRVEEKCPVPQSLEQHHPGGWTCVPRGRERDGVWLLRARLLRLAIPTAKQGKRFTGRIRFEKRHSKSKSTRLLGVRTSAAARERRSAGARRASG